MTTALKIVLTGARGFLGQHVRAAALEYGHEVVGVPLGVGFDTAQAAEAVRGANRVIHLAGVNRGTDADVEAGNLQFAEQIASVIEEAGEGLESVVVSNSIQAGNGSVYGTAKQVAAQRVSSAAARRGADFVDLHLPNLFGEYGRPFYNSVVATFCHLIAKGETPEVHENRELALLHAQDAADLLLGEAPEDAMEELSQSATVIEVKNLLEEFSETYSLGEFPDLSTDFRRNLFNTYRSYTFPDATPVEIARHADDRGSFFEVVRSRGGTGQTSFSTTAPGITRGEHFHRRKVERFTVLSGEALISLRHLFDNEVFSFRVSGDEPKSVDMPTLYTHNITNIGTETLYTAFWTNDIFHPTNPDTIPEAVQWRDD